MTRKKKKEIEAGISTASAAIQGGWHWFFHHQSTQNIRIITHRPSNLKHLPPQSVIYPRKITKTAAICCHCSLVFAAFWSSSSQPIDSSLLAKPVSPILIPNWRIYHQNQNRHKVTAFISNFWLNHHFFFFYKQPPPSYWLKGKKKGKGMEDSLELGF